MTNLYRSLAAVAQPQTQADRFAIISFGVRTLMTQGMPARAAFDAMLGDGQWDAMVSDLYDTLTAQ